MSLGGGIIEANLSSELFWFRKLSKHINSIYRLVYFCIINCIFGVKIARKLLFIFQTKTMKVTRLLSKIIVRHIIHINITKQEKQNNAPSRV